MPHMSATKISPSSGSRIPTTNTDIFLKYSDNGGLTWSTAVEVNDDDALADGYSAVERIERQ